MRSGQFLTSNAQGLFKMAPKWSDNKQKSALVVNRIYTRIEYIKIAEFMLFPGHHMKISGLKAGHYNLDISSSLRHLYMCVQRLNFP